MNNKNRKDKIIMDDFDAIYSDGYKDGYDACMLELKNAMKPSVVKAILKPTRKSSTRKIKK